MQEKSLKSSIICLNKDFSLNQYKTLLESFRHQAFSFLPFNEFLYTNDKNTICLRHDVDQLPYNSLELAQIQHTFGIRGSYYFRSIPKSWNEDVIQKIHSLEHEVGYHYESLTTTRGNLKLAIADFKNNLGNLRKLVPVNTICMHGSPRSKWNSIELWKYYNYKDYGIIGEPYFDIDFSVTAYYTDTGRMWDGQRFSVRDKVDEAANKFPSYHTTHQMIRAINDGTFPERAMITFHPQRWTDKPFPWLKELVWQRTKNMVKYFLIRNDGKSQS
jgi:hypothetical protein